MFGYGLIERENHRRPEKNQKAGAPFEVPGAAIWGALAGNGFRGRSGSRFCAPGPLYARYARASCGSWRARARAADAAQLRGLAEADAADADAAA